MLRGFAPIYTDRARLLILGSFPSVASLGSQQYYAHPQNQFWKIIGALLELDLYAMPYEARIAHVQQARIAIWDVLRACDRAGSLDSAIRHSESNPLRELTARLPRLEAVAFNGKTAAKAAGLLEGLAVKRYALPSTSPAYASLRFEQKLAAWSVLREGGHL